MLINELKMRVGLFLGQFSPTMDGNYTRPMSIVPDTHIKSFADYIAALPDVVSEQPDDCRAALKELVELKEYKDKNGKDIWYQRDQPLAWERAKEALASAPMRESGEVEK